MNMQRLILSLWWLLVAAFLSVTVYYVMFHHVVPLSRDQWHMYDALLTQGLWKTSITTVSGHRHILAFLLYDIDLNWFHGRNHFLIALDWLLNIGLITVICRQIASCISDTSSRHFLVGWVLLLLCWLINIALLGWGFNGINNYLSIVNIVLSVLFLFRAVHQYQNRTRFLVLSLLCGGLATLSFGNGILAWPIGLISLCLWRAPRQFFIVFAAAAVVFFLLYLLLPGGDAVGKALHINSWKTLAFPVTLMGGPFFHLLRAWRLFSQEALTLIASGVGALVCSLAALMLYTCWHRRGKLDVLDALSVALILLGFGTVALLMLTRVDGVLDPAVDRFQVWALMVWLGVSVLLYRGVSTISARRCWQIGFLLFPVLALPSQLDWGARLAEYRTRVDDALLAYQVYLPVSADAEKALHWNWQGKLLNFFPVLENIRAAHRNVFVDGAASWLGKPLPDAAQLPACHWLASSVEPLHAADLLNVQPYPASAPYAITASSPDQVLGWRWRGHLDEPTWSYGLISDTSGVVRGLLHPVRASVLPRANGAVNTSDNAYGVARLSQAAMLLVMEDDKPLCISVLH